ncbi:MAG: hypothetical protein HQL53_09140 [Magnetococcales bacterium]|nr:hypothetical protein [Magnetococcales bacterium]
MHRSIEEANVRKLYPEPHITLGEIKERLREAADTERRLPKMGPSAVRAAWPEPKALSQYAHSRDVRTEPPSVEAIARYDACQLWLDWVSHDEKKVIWCWAHRTPWKLVENRMHRSRSWLYNVFRTGLAKIESRLMSDVI